MEAIFILDQSTQPILSSRLPSSICPQAILHTLAHHLRHPDPNPIIHLAPTSILCHLAHHKLRFAALTTADLEPSTVFGFLHQFIRLLSFYLHSQVLSPTLIQAHFSLVLQLISLSAPPPATPLALSSAAQPDLIAAILPRPSPGISTFLAQAADSIKSTASSIASRPTSTTSPAPRSAPSLFGSPIPWRPANLHYPHEEVYLDICESLTATLDRNGAVIASCTGGRIDVQSKLSGMPELVLSFTNPSQVLNSPGFHPSVRHGRWLRDRTLSFIPPDRPFTLMSYRTRPLATKLPISCRVSVTSGTSGGTFEIQISASTSKPLTKICVRWKLGDQATGLMSDSLLARLLGYGTSLESSSSASNRSALFVERWEWEEDEKCLVWFIENILAGQNVSLEGIWNHSSDTNRPAPSIQITFEIPTGSPSTTGVIVDKLIVDHHHQDGQQGSMVQNHQQQQQQQVQKGVRYQLENGRIELRWT